MTSRYRAAQRAVELFTSLQDQGLTPDEIATEMRRRGVPARHDVSDPAEDLCANVQDIVADFAKAMGQPLIEDTQRARAEAAEQRAEALEREVARLRADRAVLMAAGLVGSNAGRTLPPNCLPMLVRLSAEVVAIVGSDDREALGAYVEALLLAEAHAAGEVSDG